MVTADDRLDARDLAALLHCTPRTARRLMGTEIPATRVGGRWTAARRDVDKYLRQQTVVGRRRQGRARSLSDA